jgi:hypothetical protein
MALSNQTISNLADALVPEVIDYIYLDERWCEFMQQVVPDALKEKLGEVDEELQFDLAMCIMDRITLKQG